MKTIIMVEKPKLADSFARILNCTVTHHGYKEGENHIITWTLGHLVTLAEPELYQPELCEWKLETLPIIPEKLKLVLIRRTNNQFAVIRGLLQRKDIQELVVATDPSREGELISRRIIYKVGWKKDYKRLWLTSHTDESIKKSLQNLLPASLFFYLFQAASSRAEADWLLGLNISRALTCKYQDHLNAGRIQTPILAKIVERENAIQNFKTQAYFSITANFDGLSAEWKKNKNSQIHTKAQAEAIIKNVLKQPGVVIRIIKEHKQEDAPLLYDLVDLQKDANEFFGFTPKQTMSILTNLYENHKLITYPKSECKYFTREVFASIPIRLMSNYSGPYKKLIEPLLGKPLLKRDERVIENPPYLHSGIIPTERPVEYDYLTEDEKQIHGLIFKRFLAQFYPAYRYEYYIFIILAGGERFHAQVWNDLEFGWKELYYQNSSQTISHDFYQFIENIRKGQKLPIIKCGYTHHVTMPPPRFHDSDILSLLNNVQHPAPSFNENYNFRIGMGSSAIHFDIVEKLIQYNYIQRQGLELMPTEKGKQLIRIMPRELVSLESCLKWENRIAAISIGKDNYSDFMNDAKFQIELMVDKIKLDETLYHLSDISEKRCPVCNEYMFLLEKENDKQYKCSNWSCGYKQIEQTSKTNVLLTHHKQQVSINKRLINRYSDNNKHTQFYSIGDLVENVLSK